MHYCQQCGKKEKKGDVNLHHFPKKFGGSQYLCQTCYQQLKQQYQTPQPTAAFSLQCPICHQPIASTDEHCPHCHHTLTTVKKEYTTPELKDDHTNSWHHNHHAPKQENVCNTCSTFSIMKPTIITIGSISAVILIVLTLCYLPAIADSDDEQFIGEWTGESLLVAKTYWDFDDDHTVEIVIDRTDKVEENYYWEITDEHITFSNLDPEDKHYTDINNSELLFLQYPVSFTYDFNMHEDQFSLGLDGTQLEIEFKK